MKKILNIKLCLLMLILFACNNNSRQQPLNSQYSLSSNSILVSEIMPQSDNCSSSITDIDGNVYQTIQIGNQCWMKENLRTTKLNDGTLLTTNLFDPDWYHNAFANQYPAYTIYEYGNGSVEEITGKLYNYFAVNTNKLCPQGWHVPSNTDLIELVDFLGGEDEAGLKLKALDGTWNSEYNWENQVTNSSRFSARPGGIRQLDGTYAWYGTICKIWASTGTDISNAIHLHLNWQNGSASIGPGYKGIGMSCRCIKD